MLPSWSFFKTTNYFLVASSRGIELPNNENLFLKFKGFQHVIASKKPEYYKSPRAAFLESLQQEEQRIQTIMTHCQCQKAHILFDERIIWRGLCDKIRKWVEPGEKWIVSTGNDIGGGDSLIIP